MSTEVHVLADRRSALAAYGLLPRIVRGVDHSVETLVPRKMRR